MQIVYLIVAQVMTFSISFARKRGILINPIAPLFTSLAVKGQSDAFIIGEVELEFNYQGLIELRRFKVMDLVKYDVILGITPSRSQPDDKLERI